MTKGQPPAAGRTRRHRGPKHDRRTKTASNEFLECATPASLWIPPACGRAGNGRDTPCQRQSDGRSRALHTRKRQRRTWNVRRTARFVRPLSGGCPVGAAERPCSSTCVHALYNRSRAGPPRRGRHPEKAPITKRTEFDRSPLKIRAYGQKTNAAWGPAPGLAAESAGRRCIGCRTPVN